MLAARHLGEKPLKLVLFAFGHVTIKLIALSHEVRLPCKNTEILLA